MAEPDVEYADEEGESMELFEDEEEMVSGAVTELLRGRSTGTMDK